MCRLKAQDGSRTTKLTTRPIATGLPLKNSTDPIRSSRGGSSRELFFKRSPTGPPRWGSGGLYCRATGITYRDAQKRASRCPSCGYDVAACELREIGRDGEVRRDGSRAGTRCHGMLVRIPPQRSLPDPVGHCRAVSSAMSARTAVNLAFPTPSTLHCATEFVGLDAHSLEHAHIEIAQAAGGCSGRRPGAGRA